MTPANLAAMCALAGLDVVALTDHNTAGNCASFCTCAARLGLIALAGMELCTREEVHVVCLFPTPDSAQAFSAFIRPRLPSIANDPLLFGPQVLMDDGDGVLGEESLLLAGAADIGLAEVPGLVDSMGGVAFPAHIDRPSNSLLSQLGFWDPTLNFPLAEVSMHCPADLFQRPDLKGLRHIYGCDAHYLDQIPSPHQYMEVPARTAQAALHWLKSEHN